jgi:manganese/zinc/iron transport system permease protein
MLTGDLYLLAGVALVVLAAVAMLFKEFKLVCFDADFAQSQGWPTLWLDLAMMAALAVVTIVGLPIVGVILMAAMIILPAATARFWTNRLNILLLLAGALGVTAGLLGTRLGRNLPAGAAIVLTAAALFLVSLLFAPERGVVARVVAEWRMRRRISREHLLRALYELGESQLPQVAELRVEQLRDHRYWKPQSLERLLQWAAADDLMKVSPDRVQLTPLGLSRAAELTRTHRLWEMYLMQQANIAADHVDRDADETEHLLPPAVRLELDQQLDAAGHLPPPLSMSPCRRTAWNGPPIPNTKNRRSRSDDSKTHD